MGRGKVNMELIKKEKARMITYQKRKKCLMKKIQEFSILCGVPTCMIIFRPKLNNRPAEIDFWPRERKDFMEVINLYREKKTNFSVRKIKSMNLFDFFANRQRKLEEEVKKLHQANFEAKFPIGSNDRLHKFSDEQVKLFLLRIDTKLEVARRKILMFKEKQALMSGFESGASGGCRIGQLLFQKNKMEALEAANRQQQFPPYYPPNQALQMLPLDLNPTDNRMTVMTMNGGDLPQFGGMSHGIGTYSQLQHPMFFNPMAAMLDKPRAMSFYGSTMQPLPLSPYEQFHLLPKLSSQTQHAAQLNPQFYGGINQFETRSNIRRL